MPTNSLSQLEKTIAAAARERDTKEQKIRDDQSTKQRLRDDTKTAWALRKSELPGLVETIDTMLKGHGYAGLAMGTFDLKHSDIDRVIIEFKHSAYNISKILMCVTAGGEFTCSNMGSNNPITPTKLLVADMTEDHLKDALAQAVSCCLSRKSVLKPD
jgi:hypothetical protein